MPKATIGDLKRMISNPSPQPSRGLIDAFKFVNLYSCVPNIPPAVAVRVGRLCTTSWLSLMYVGRLANLGVYLISVLLCLRLLPNFHLTLV